MLYQVSESKQTSLLLCRNAGFCCVSLCPHVRSHSNRAWPQLSQFSNMVSVKLSWEVEISRFALIHGGLIIKLAEKAEWFFSALCLLHKGTDTVCSSAKNLLFEEGKDLKKDLIYIIWTVWKPFRFHITINAAGSVKNNNKNILNSQQPLCKLEKILLHQSANKERWIFLNERQIHLINQIYIIYYKK